MDNFRRIGLATQEELLAQGFRPLTSEDDGTIIERMFIPLNCCVVNSNFVFLDYEQFRADYPTGGLNLTMYKVDASGYGEDYNYIYFSNPRGGSSITWNTQRGPDGKNYVKNKLTLVFSGPSQLIIGDAGYASQYWSVRLGHTVGVSYTYTGSVIYHPYCTLDGYMDLYAEVPINGLSGDNSATMIYTKIVDGCANVVKYINGPVYIKPLQSA